MKNDVKIYLRKLQSIMQTDPGQRGIARCDELNLCTCTNDHLIYAVEGLSADMETTIAIVTGFYIPDANPPAPENDGPMGAIALANVLRQLGFRIVIVADQRCLLAVDNQFTQALPDVELVQFPISSRFPKGAREQFQQWMASREASYPDLKAIVSIECPGPCHSKRSVSEQYGPVSMEMSVQFKTSGPERKAGRVLNMWSKDITRYVAPLHWWFKQKTDSVFTIGIGDGGNEIGMGSIPWHVIQQNIKNGGVIACRVPTDATIVAGVSNWGGYALAAAMAINMNQPQAFLDHVTEMSETALLEWYASTGVAVDGVHKRPNMTVDGLPWDVHLSVIREMRQVVDDFKNRDSEGNGNV
ncbi:DUF4392 domain-containing protein [candidate division KSB1 bacterium]|nr:DUF4392 domain-containing protein [candidate division KSB1 bacterium]